MQVLILELNNKSDVLRDDGSEMRWLTGRIPHGGLGYIDYLRIINLTNANVIGFVNINEYPAWFQLAVHAHEARKDVWLFTRGHERLYQWAKVFHPETLIRGCCWTKEMFSKCYLNYEYVNSVGERKAVRRFNRVHRCYKGIYCKMEGN